MRASSMRNDISNVINCLKISVFGYKKNPVILF
jgi:hypothetical protein